MSACAKKGMEGYIMTDVVDFIISKQKNKENLYGLLSILYSDARQKKNRVIYASNSYLMINTGWGEGKVTRYKKELERLKIIKVVKKQKKSDKFKQKQYIELLYLRESDDRIKNYHSSVKEAKLPQKKPRSKRTIFPKQQSNTEPTPKSKPVKPSDYDLSRRYLPQAKRLAEIVMSKRNVKITESQIRKWCVPIRELEVEKGIRAKRMDKLLDWYAVHIGEEYVNVIHSGGSFKEKFTDLEANIENWDKKGRTIKSNSYKEHKRENAYKDATVASFNNESALKTIKQQWDKE